MVSLFYTTQIDEKFTSLPRCSPSWRTYTPSLEAFLRVGDLRWRVRDPGQMEKQCKALQMEHWASSSLNMPMARESSLVYFSDSSFLFTALNLWENRTKNKTKHKFLLLSPAEKLNHLTLLWGFLLSLMPQFFMVPLMDFWDIFPETGASL